MPHYAQHSGVCWGARNECWTAFWPNVTEYTSIIQCSPLYIHPLWKSEPILSELTQKPGSLAMWWTFNFMCLHSPLIFFFPKGSLQFPNRYVCWPQLRNWLCHKRKTSTITGGFGCRFSPGHGCRQTCFPGTKSSVAWCPCQNGGNLQQTHHKQRPQGEPPTQGNHLQSVT